MCAMFLTSLVIHVYFEVRCPQSTLHASADYLEIVAPHAPAAIDGIMRLGQFVDFLGVPLDPGKTFTWALDTQGRKVFREANWKVEYSQKDLGAHKQYSGQRTNKTIVRFFDQLDTRADHDPRRDAIHADMVIPLHQLSSKLDAAAPRARIAQFSKVQNWLRHLQVSEDVPPTWVTWPELMSSFRAYTGIQGITTAANNSGWVEASVCYEYDANRECHTFAYYLTHLIRYWNPEFKSTFTDPSNFRWQCWAKCMPIRWNRADASAVHGWLESHLGARVLRAVRTDLCDAPPATSICAVVFWEMWRLVRCRTSGLQIPHLLLLGPTD